MNYARTALLMAAMTGLFLALGWALGGQQGMTMALVVALAMNFFSYWFSDKLVLRMHGAREIAEADAPQFYGIVRELAQRAQMPMPKVYVMDNEQPNAFATGRNPKHAAVAVTSGIMQALPPRELEGVIAHELAHIKNRDILIASMAAMVAGAISAIVNFLQFSLLFGGGDDEGSPLGFIGTIAAIILAPLAAVVIQMAISRQREYVADATGAEFLGDPLPLADALVRLHRGAEVVPMQVNQAAAPLYIVNPLAGFGRKMSGLFSTHPPMEERVARLRAMAGHVQGV